MLHMTQVLTFVYYFDKKKGQLLSYKAVFTMWVPEENALLGSCHHSQEKFIFSI